MYGDLRNIISGKQKPILPKKFKRVLIATPSISYTVSSHYATSLGTSSIVCFDNGIILDSLILNGESILPMARNKCIQEAVKRDYDDLIFIDEDQSWNPQALLDIIKSPKKVIGIPVALKIEDKNIFNYHPSKDEKKDKLEDMVTVERIGTGFLKINKEVLKKLYSNSEEIIFRDSKIKNICEYSILSNTFIGEDYVLCNKIKDIGYDIWISTKHSSDHHGRKTFSGDLKKYHSEHR
jgi:hypothetical protein